MSTAPRSPSPLRSLVVKLTLVAALVMLAFGWLRSTFTTWAFDLFAIPGPSVSAEDRAHDALVAVMRDRNAAQDPAIARQLDTYFEQRRTREVLAFVLDRHGDIVARSPELATVDESMLTAAPRYRLVTDGKLVGVVYSYVRPVHEDQKLQGFITSMSYELDLDRVDSVVKRPDGSDWRPFADAPQLDLPAGTDLVLSEELLAAEDARIHHYERISNGVTIGIAVTTALLLGICASFLVTRRLRRLAREVEESAAEELPGPFHESGKDEIGRLAGALNAMRARITELVRDLRQQDQHRREWIAQVSHDIRTPLTALSACIERAEAAQQNGDHAVLEDALQLARHDLRRARSFVDDLFEIARLEIGDELVRESIPPLELVTDAARSLRPVAEQNGINMRIEGNGEVAEIDADGHRLLRACENLLSNAIRHAGSQVRIGAQSVANGVRFYVADDGDGFAGGRGAVDLAAVSKRVHQADSSGLGLLVARRVAEAHAGTLTAQNDVSGWTLVELVLPFQSSPSPQLES